MDERTIVIEKITKVTKTRKICLEDDEVKRLRIKGYITTFEITQETDVRAKKSKIVSQKQINQEEKDLATFELSEISLDTLLKHRKSQKAFFIFKDEEKYYYSRIPRNLNVVGTTFLGSHLCATTGVECNHLSAASDENGGCAKVRGCSRGIERYSWITKGYETVNTEHDAFIVINCSHYEKIEHSKQISDVEINKAKLCIAQFLWPDVDNIEQLEKKTKNIDTLLY